MEEAEVTGTIAIVPEPAQLSRQEIQAKHWAVRINIKSLGDSLREAADLALAGRLKETWRLRNRSMTLLSNIIYQLTEVAVATNPKQIRRPKRKQRKEAG